MSAKIQRPLQTEPADQAPAEPVMSRPRLTAALVSSALFMESFDSAAIVVCKARR